MNELVYTELVDGIPVNLLEDKKLLIISDSAIFLIATESHSKCYNYEFYPVPIEAVEAYNIVLENGTPKQK